MPLPNTFIHKPPLFTTTITNYLPLLPLILLLLLLTTPTSADSTTQFQTWYPQYAHVFHTLLHTNCTAELAAYRSGIKDPAKIDHLGGGTSTSILTQPVVNCLLEYASEYVKSQLSTAQVLLGVAPTILAILGPRADEMAALVLVGRRGVLFVILACGSPSVYFGRAFEEASMRGLLVGGNNNEGEGEGRMEIERVMERQRVLPISGVRRTGGTNAVAAGVEYVLAMVAVANVAALTYRLGSRTICIIWSTSGFAPFTWAATGVFNYVLCAVMIRMRVRRVGREKGGDGDGGDGDDGDNSNNRGFGGWVRRWVAREVQLAATQRDVRIEEFPESHAYVVLSWLSSACIITHVLFGTVVFSSLLFIGPEDAMTIVLRYAISVMLCRMVLIYELAGLRDAYALSNHPGVVTGEDGLPSLVSETKRPTGYLEEVRTDVF